MKIKRLHNWNVSYAEARTLQADLAEKVCFESPGNRIRLIAGLDCAISKDGRQIIAAVVILRPIRPINLFHPDSWREEPVPKMQKYTLGRGLQTSTAGFEPVATAQAVGPIGFPYIPGLLSFREAPVCLDAVEKLDVEPDVFMIDGQGIAHPRRLGLAAHLGLFFDKPTIGCAKSRLLGDFTEPPDQKGAWRFLTTPATHDHARRSKPERIGAVVRTRTDVKPLFISVGHKCTLEQAIGLTLRCATRYRLPEPTRLAHQFVRQFKTQL